MHFTMFTDRMLISTGNNNWEGKVQLLRLPMSRNNSHIR